MKRSHAEPASSSTGFHSTSPERRSASPAVTSIARRDILAGSGAAAVFAAIPTQARNSKGDAAMPDTLSFVEPAEPMIISGARIPSFAALHAIPPGCFSFRAIDDGFAPCIFAGDELIVDPSKCASSLGTVLLIEEEAGDRNIWIVSDQDEIGVPNLPDGLYAVAPGDSSRIIGPAPSGSFAVLGEVTAILDTSRPIGWQIDAPCALLAEWRHWQEVQAASDRCLNTKALSNIDRWRCAACINRIIHLEKMIAAVPATSAKGALAKLELLYFLKTENTDARALAADPFAWAELELVRDALEVLAGSAFLPSWCNAHPRFRAS